MVTFTLNCKVKDGNPQTQLIPEEATLLCKSSKDAESKVSSWLLQERKHGEIYL